MHADQPQDGSGLQQRPHRIDPEPAVLVKLRIELPFAGPHLRQRAEGNHLVGLVTEQPVAADDLGALGVGGVQHDGLGARGDGIEVDVGAAIRVIGPRAGEVNDFLPRPRFGRVTEEERVRPARR